METEKNQIRIKIKDVALFTNMASVEVSDTEGVTKVEGTIEGSEDLVTQSYRFDLEKNWTIEKAHIWLNEHDEDSAKNIDSTLCFSKLEDVEIFATGKWNGHNYTDADLDGIVRAYKEIGDKLQVYLKLGHDENQKLLQADGLPAAGWMTALRKVNDKLVANFEEVPEVISELIKKRAYARISSELYINYKATKEETGAKEKVYPLALRAVALLGGDTPAVTTLQDVVALYVADETINKSKSIEFTIEELTEKRRDTKMDEKELKEIQEKLDAEKAELEKKAIEVAEAAALLVTEKEEFSKKQVETVALDEKLSKYSTVIDSFSDIDSLKAAVEDFKTVKAEAEEAKKTADALIEEAKVSEMKSFISDNITAGKVLPAQRDMLEKILLAADSETICKFAKDDLYGLKEEMSLVDTIKAYVSAQPNLEILLKYSSTKRTAKGEEDQDDLVRKYMKEHDESDYGKAQVAVAKIRPDLFERDNED